MHIALAKCIATHLGAPERIWSRHLEIEDTLAAQLQWPIYPEIGRDLSVPAAYDWVERGRHCDLDQFIDRSYRRYAESGIQPADIELSAPPEVRRLFDRVLGNQSRHSA